MAKVSSTREIIEKLQEYEEKHGIGAVIGISTICNADRAIEFIFEVVNDSDYNRVFNNKDDRYKETQIKISSIDDNILFDSINHGSKYTFNCEFMDDNEYFLSVLVYENNNGEIVNKYELWINMTEDPETMYYMNGNKPKDKNFEDILLEYLEDNYPDYFPPAIQELKYNDLSA